MPAQTLLLRNGQAAARRAIPVLPFSAFRETLSSEVSAGGRLASLFAWEEKPGRATLSAVVARGKEGVLSLFSTEVGDRYPSLTPECPQAHLFERELAEQWSVVPDGHPWLKPVRFHSSYSSRPGTRDNAVVAEPLPGRTPFFRVEGDEVHEVAVGPVHAGIIEPGHFRFQCHGEKVLHLEISLGYQHRGVERALLGGPTTRTISYMETMAGDTTVGHAAAYCGVVEALAGVTAPPSAQMWRGVALELERLANHTGDLGALAGDVGYLPTAAYGGRLRGDFLNMTAMLCGNRFSRGLLRPGGVAMRADGILTERLLEKLEAAFRDVRGAVSLLWDTPSVMARFEETGVVSGEQAESLGLVGPPARAAGLVRDVRTEFPWGPYLAQPVPIAVQSSGDVWARAAVRWTEIRRSVEFLRQVLSRPMTGSLREPMRPLAPDSVAVTLVEGWRGEICHTALTDPAGRFLRYKIVDPSFHNWMGLALALRGQEISDFPLCNKSFNLSYSGHDL